MRVRFTARARTHLDAIVEYVAHENRRAAHEIAQAIERLASSLEEHPNLGHPTRLKGVRILTVPHLPYRMSYEIGRNEIRILTVRHTSRRPLRSFR